MIKKIVTFLILVLFPIQASYSIWADEISMFDDIFQESIYKNFKPIDEKIETYLTNLSRDKNYCFGEERQKTFVECVDFIEKTFSISWKYAVWDDTWWDDSYSEACTKSLWETIDNQEEQSIPSVDSTTILDRSKGACSELYKFKLSIYKSVAYDILKKNKYAILKDEHKLFTQKNRTKYDKLLDLIRINLWYIERLWKKWPSKTK